MGNSRELLRIALAILDDNGITKNCWAVGGGTVLSEFFHHRLSKDIDIFIDDIQLLASLSPRLNNQCEDLVDYEEREHFISMTFPMGKLDFIAAPQLTKFPPSMRLFNDFTVPMEDAVEIVCKKMYFRGSKALPRDIFDLATVFHSNRKMDLLDELSKMPDKIAAFEHRFLLQKISGAFTPYSKEYGSLLLPAGQKIKGQELQICKDLLNELEKNMQQKKGYDR